ncbi:MAG: heavy-metal-associated domain-containing protein [Bacteroidota bacterium]|nr:heavy-metal-associated domain-containing protein [Bacteroidota bacterium]
MNNSKTLITLMLFIAMCATVTVYAQSKNTQTETFKVWGNCGMCKKTIEKSLKTKGVSKAEWNMETKMMTVVFNPKKVSLAQIHKNIASVGYDTELERASDDVYNKLHGCCKYERKKQ